MNQQSGNVIAHQPLTLLGALVPSRRPGRGAASEAAQGGSEGSNQMEVWTLSPQRYRGTDPEFGEICMDDPGHQGLGTSRCRERRQQREEWKTNPTDLTRFLSMTYRRIGRNKPKRDMFHGISNLERKGPVFGEI